MRLPNLKEAKIRSEKSVEIIYQNKNYDKTFLDGQKFYLRTYGCQMNVHDSEEIRRYLTELGATETKEVNSAEVIILNTCAIRENAHDKVFGFLGRCKHLKSKNPNTTIIVCGCMAQEEIVAKEIIERHPYIDIVIGTHNIHLLPEKIINKKNNLDIEVYSIEGNVYENTKYERDSKIKAWVNIMYGCDKFCTYCIVPYTRGKQRSRRHEDILKEIKDLVNTGYQEVTLLGQNVNAYGKDLAGELSFAELLELVSQSGINRIRFVTSHPWDFTDELIEVIKSNKNIMPYIHLPIQSGSNNILKLMGRRYSKDDYIKLFEKIKKSIPNVSITTDIIVGFPNEMEEDFENTLEVVNICKFDGAFTFIYSPREGTPAATIEDNITKEIKEERLQKLNKLVNKYSLENNKKLVNQIVPILVEGVSEKDEAKVFGYTDTQKLVNVVGHENLIGKIVDVKILAAKSFSLDGETI